jgi:flagellar hook-length control protein FliK
LRVIHAQLGRDRSTATLRLDPPELGRIVLRMELNREQLALRIDTETDAARRLLTEQVNALRRGLEASGIQLERFDVRAPEPPAHAAEQQALQRDDLPAGHDNQASAEQDRSAGGHSSGATEAHPADDGDTPTSATQPEPVTESRVNILA